MNTTINWHETLTKSATLFDKSAKGKKQASVLLWDGAQAAIEEWLPNASSDVQAENLYGEVLDALGTPRKGDASKIKTVALAVKKNGLVLSVYPNLSKAYAEATRLTKTVKQHAAEDDAAEKAIEALAAPGTTKTVDGAAHMVLSKGIDGAVVAIFDALTDAAKKAGANPEDAIRSFIRACSTEAAARMQAAKPKPVKKAVASTPKAGAVKVTPGDGATKPKPAAKKAATKPKPVKVEAPVEEDVTEPEVDDMFDLIDGEEATVEEVVTEAPVRTKPKPVRKPIRR